MLVYHGTRQQLVGDIAGLVAILAGRAPDPTGLARGFQLAIGVAFLSDIKKAYITKADGGTDEMGVSWPDLKPETKAYKRRFGPGEKASLKRAHGLGRGHRHRGLLSAAQDKEWKGIFASVFNRLRLSLDEGEAKARAAQTAWAVMKKRGAKTMLEVYGNRKVQILRDTGRLLNSISPGEVNGDQYTKPAGDGGEEQVMLPGIGELIVGTNVKYARVHNDGDPKRGIPRRQIFPDEGQELPASWQENIGDAAARALVRVIELHLAA